MWFAWLGLINNAPENIKPTESELSDWANKSKKEINFQNYLMQ